MEKQSKSGGCSKASMTLGIWSMVFTLLPLLSAWFMLLTFVNCLLAPIGTVCGIVGIVKSQNLTKSIIGLILCVLAICTPFIFGEYYLESASDSLENLFDMIG